MSSSIPTRLIKLRLAALGVMLANSVYLFIANRLPAPPRSEFAGLFYMGNAVLHFVLGFALVIPFLMVVRAFFRTVSTGAAQWLSALAVVSGAVCLGFGVSLFITGATAPYRWVLNVHVAAAVVCIASFVVYLALRLRRLEATDFERWAWTPTVGVSPLVVLIPLIFLGVSSLGKAPERVIENPDLPPLTAFEEGSGRKNHFFPSSAQSVGNTFFPSEYFVDSKSCGVKGCHPDIYKQWFESAHHFSSFNNQWYRKSIEYMQEVIGTESSKWCGGCHDMAILLTERPGTGKPRMDFPIKDQVWPPERFPEAHAGIGCAVCHSIVHVKSTMGQGDYLADYPPMHKYAITGSDLMKQVHNFIIRRAPEPHKKTFLKPFHRNETAKFCSSCHKVHLHEPVNRFHWFRGFNDYDSWQQSGVSGQGARSFYYPPDGFKKCGKCHMPFVASNDAGNIGGFVHSHRFPAANTALPFINGHKEQLEATKKFLQNGFITVDIFALRRSTDFGSGLNGLRRANPLNPLPKSADKPKTQNPEPETSSLMGGEVGGHETRIQAVDVGEVNEEFIAPLSNATLRRGEEALIDVVVRTRKIGHAFPGGTVDAFDVWLELKAVDNKGKVLLWNGNLEKPNGPVDRWAHKYRALLVDGQSNRINKRNAWAARARVYARAIPPGAADTVHYRLKIPQDCGDQVTITAKLNYRKFEWWNTQFAFAGRPVDKEGENYSTGNTKQAAADSLIKPAATLARTPALSRPGTKVGIGLNKIAGAVTAHWDNRPWKFDADLSIASPGNVKKVPDLPIVTLAENTVTLQVVDASSSTTSSMTSTQDDPKKLSERWNDYGIGFLLQGDFKRAEMAFRKVMEIAPDWAEGYVNLGRVKWQEGDLTEAKQVIEKAFKVWETKPDRATNPNVPKVYYFYGRVLKDMGYYDEALKHLRTVTRTFPDDRVVRNQMGQILFRQMKFDEAIKEFKHTLSIDPEDIEAHYGLNLCYRGKGDLKRAELHTKLYNRFKAVESTDHLAGPYKVGHTWDNNESRQIHEHS